MISLSKTISLLHYHHHHRPIRQKLRSLTNPMTSSSSSSISLKFHAFAGNPLKPKTPKTLDPLSPSQALESLKTRLLADQTLAGGSGSGTGSPAPEFRVLPFRKGRPLAMGGGGGGAGWRLGWKGVERLGGPGRWTGDEMVYLGSEAAAESESEFGLVYWAAEVWEGFETEFGEENEKGMSFVELRTLMVATDWEDHFAMAQLAIAGHARALLEWHNVSKFCGRCGEKNVSKEAGRRKQCSNDSCGHRVYPRTDPVVIMLVIDKENDRALLSRQSRFVPRMWSCLAGFMEPGESLEEAVRRETWEETGIEVGQVMYHSSQPWPVGPSSIPCQLMVGFHAYAKSLEINVDKEELEDAKWHSRENVKKALLEAEYKKAQRTAAAKVEQMCTGVERKGQSFSKDFNVESGELAPMFFPGPFAIAHHLISSWAFQDEEEPNRDQNLVKHLSSSFSNL